MKVVTDLAKKPFDRIRGHLVSARYVRLTEQKRKAEKQKQQQPTVSDVSYPQRVLEMKTDGAFYTCVKVFCKSGISLEQADQPDDAERSFSKLRYLQQLQRSLMSDRLLNVQLIIYKNRGDSV